MNDKAIMILKMKSGIEIVGELAALEDEQVALRSPYLINYKSIPGLPFPVVSLKHYILFAEDGVFVPFLKRDISATVIARESFARFFKMTISTTMMGQIDNLLDDMVRGTDTRGVLNDDDTKRLKELSYKQQLEEFDVTGEYSN